MFCKKFVVIFGCFSMVYIMNRLGLSSQLQPISKAHGKSFNADTSYGSVKIIPLYHPAVAVYNSNMKEELKKDFEILKNFK